MIRGSIHLTPCLLLLACAAPPDETRWDNDEARRNMQFDASLTTAELIAEMERQWSLVRTEKGSVQEPIVRAQVEEEISRIQIAASPPDGVAEPSGTYMIDARLLDDGSPIRVHVPDDVSLSKGGVLDVVAGQHGYYFHTVVESE